MLIYQNNLVIPLRPMCLENQRQIQTSYHTMDRDSNCQSPQSATLAKRWNTKVRFLDMRTTLIQPAMSLLP